MSYIYQTKSTQTPILVGKTVQEALCITAQHSLSIKLIKEQEDPELPSGTIMLQNPQPHTPIKSHQTIHCVVSKKTEQQTPFLLGRNIKDCTPELEALGLKYKIHALASSAPEGMCIAQDPAPGTTLSLKFITLYVAKGILQHYMFPDLRQKSVEKVQTFLSNSPVTIQIMHAFEMPEDHECTNCIVSEQRPRAGTIVFIDKEKPIRVQLVATPVLNSNE